MRSEPQIVLREGKPWAVILKLKEYRELLERAEAWEDLKYLRTLRKRPLKFRKLADFPREYRTQERA